MKWICMFAAAVAAGAVCGEYRFDDPRNYVGVWSGSPQERVA